MILTSKYLPLTPSGRGARITDRRVTDFSVEELRDLLDEHQWLAFQENPGRAHAGNGRRTRPVTAEEVTKCLRRLGRLVQNDRRQGAVLKLDGSKKEEVLLGEGFMPLHRDGALMGTDVAVVGIFCVEHQDVSGGRTFISDIEGATREVPREYLDLIREKGIEGRPVDRYYTKAADAWHWIPGFIDVGGKSYLNVGFPYRAGEKASWLVRIPGVDDARVQAIFEEMRAVLMSERYCYYHEWKEGELLLLDNRRTLHGREAFRGRRSLANIQVLAA
jgi:alpha-ketoglutarate-dependent taurine dioxygenase